MFYCRVNSLAIHSFTCQFSLISDERGSSGDESQCQSQHNIVTYKSPCAYHPTAPSGPPTDVVATALSATTVSVSWQPPALLDQNGVVTAYQVVLVDTSNESRKMSSVGGNTLTLLFQGMQVIQKICSTTDMCLHVIFSVGLNEYTTYSVSVAANNSLGIGPYSQPVEVTTHESSKSIILLFLLT